MTTITVKDQAFEVTLRADLWLSALVGEETVIAENKDKLAEQIRRKLAVKRKDRAIPVVIRVGGLLQRAVLRGLAAKRGEVLVTIGGEKTQLDSQQVVAPGDALTDEQIAEINQLAGAKRPAEQALRAAERAAGLSYFGGIRVQGLLEQDQ